MNNELPTINYEQGTMNYWHLATGNWQLASNYYAKQTQFAGYTNERSLFNNSTL
jgi:hypothetical protein